MQLSALQLLSSLQHMPSLDAEVSLQPQGVCSIPNRKLSTAHPCCRMLYGFSRDRAVPFWQVWQKIDDSGVPIHAGEHLIISQWLYCRIYLDCSILHLCQPLLSYQPAGYQVCLIPFQNAIQQAFYYITRIRAVDVGAPCCISVRDKWIPT